MGEPENFKKKLWVGVAAVLGKGAIRWPITLLGTAILARLLIPEDYGLFGLVTGIQVPVQSLGDFGLSVAAVHKADLT